MKPLHFVGSVEGNVMPVSFKFPAAGFQFASSCPCADCADWHKTAIIRPPFPPVSTAHVSNSPLQNKSSCPWTGPYMVTYTATANTMSCVRNLMNISKMWSNTITGLDRPWGFQESEAPIFQDNRHMKVGKLSALRTGRLNPQGNIPGTHFC